MRTHALIAVLFMLSAPVCASDIDISTDSKLDELSKGCQALIRHAVVDDHGSCHPPNANGVVLCYGDRAVISFSTKQNFGACAFTMAFYTSALAKEDKIPYCFHGDPLTVVKGVSEYCVFPDGKSTPVATCPTKFKGECIVDERKSAKDGL